MKLCVVSHKEVWRSPSAASGFATDGGTPFQIQAISSLFDETDWIVCERSAPADYPGNPLPANGLRVVRLPQPRGIDGTRKLFLAGTAGYYLGRIAARVAQADAVHAVVPGDIGMLGMLVALAMRKRVFVRYCGAWPNSPQTTRACRLCKRLMVRYAGGRNVMFATGLGDIPPDGPGGRMRWIFSASMGTADFDALERETAQREAVPGFCRLVFVGRLSPEKGLPNLLEALARLVHKPATVNYQLTLVGHGPEQGALQARVAALGLGERVRFTGLLDFTGVCRELAAADLFVLPSLTESWGNAVLEAMVGGVPVVASGVGAIPTILGTDGEYGLVVRPGEVEALAGAIGALAADPARREAIRQRARPRARQWTLEAWADQIGATLEGVWSRPLKDARAVCGATHVS